MLIIVPYASAQTNDPQYIFVRKENTCLNCFNWGGNDPNQINMDAINEIFNSTGIGTKGTASRKVGIGVLFFYNQVPMSNLKISLQRLLDYSQVHDFPVFIVLDGFEWWDLRPELWNWWDPSIAGYNPDNKNNVEWTCWDSSCAVNKAWRNWGSEFQYKPAPNIASPAFIAVNKAALTELVPIITNWYQNLPQEKKYLLGGVSAFNEQDIGANYYYYPNGISNGQGIKVSVQTGFAAVRTYGIRSSGTITSADIDAAIRQYETTLDKTIFDLGIPRNKIFNHNGGKGLAPFIEYPQGVSFQTLDSAFNNYGQPGWSFYGDVTQNPQNYPELTNALNKLGNAPWAIPEWLTYAQDYNGWVQALRTSLSYRNNRFINIANWEGMMKGKRYVLDAVKTVANENPTCWVTMPMMKNISVTGGQVNLTWQKGTSNDAVYLNIASNADFTDSGTLSTINIVNDIVTSRTNYLINNLQPGKYYWELIADGCGNQRKISDGSFTIPSPPKPGDINSDGKIDNSDIMILIADLGKTADFNVKSDLHQDNRIDLMDLVFLAKLLTN